jgi:hypothetical protein
MKRKSKIDKLKDALLKAEGEITRIELVDADKLPQPPGAYTHMVVNGGTWYVRMDDDGSILYMTVAEDEEE